MSYFSVADSPTDRVAVCPGAEYAVFLVEVIDDATGELSTSTSLADQPVASAAQQSWKSSLDFSRCAIVHAMTATIVHIQGAPKVLCCICKHFS